MSTELKIDLDAPPDPAVLATPRPGPRPQAAQRPGEFSRRAGRRALDRPRAQARVAAARTAHQARIGPGKEVSEAEALAIQIGQELLAQVAYERARRFDSQHRDAAKSAPRLPRPSSACTG